MTKNRLEYDRIKLTTMNVNMVNLTETSQRPTLMIEYDRNLAEFDRKSKI